MVYEMRPLSRYQQRPHLVEEDSRILKALLGFSTSSVTPQPTHIPDADARKIPLDERCRMLAEVGSGPHMGKFTTRLESAAFLFHLGTETIQNFRRSLLSPTSIEEFRREAKAAMQNPIGNVRNPFQQEFDGIRHKAFDAGSTDSSPQGTDWFETASLIHTLRGSQTVFLAESIPENKSSYDLATAPRHLMFVEKVVFMMRLGAERMALTNSNVELRRVMDGIIPLVAKTDFYEVEAGPMHGIPAYFSEHGPMPGIHFARGAFNFSLALHEMGHRLQMETNRREVWSHSANAIHYFDPHNTTSREQYLVREEEVYQWNVDYALHKAGYTESGLELAKFEFSLRQISRLQEMNSLKIEDCTVLAGKAPQAYAEVAKMMQRIEQIPDYSRAEIESAQAHVLAYYNIDVDNKGILRIAKGQLPWLLAQFYSGYLDSEK